MGKDAVAPLAGPSRQQNSKKLKKNAKPLVRTSKLKKLTEKQKIEALEKAAVDYVYWNIPSVHHKLITRTGGSS